MHAKAAPAPYTLVTSHDDLVIDRVRHPLRPALVQGKVTSPTAVRTRPRHLIFVWMDFRQAYAQTHRSPSSLPTRRLPPVYLPFTILATVTTTVTSCAKPRQ